MTDPEPKCPKCGEKFAYALMLVSRESCAMGPYYSAVCDCDEGFDYACDLNDKERDRYEK